MVNYNNGKIYKIEPISGGEDGDVYIGSTTKKYLSQRMANHRSNYKSWKNGKLKTNFTSLILFDKYGVENCQIVLLELVNVKTKDELVERESFYIRTMNCVNKVIPDRTREEYSLMYCEINKEAISITRKLYRDNNKETLRVISKNYHENNKEAINAQKKIYRENNKEKISAINKNYRDNNKEKISVINKKYRDSKK
jgi:predicted GIY-YIG superfamily endonuclease